MLVLLSLKISDNADEVSNRSVDEDEANTEEEVVPLEFVTATAIR
jgi:hypothetical protein